MKTKYSWTRINNDENGNPRYVVHYSALTPDLGTPEDWKEHGMNTISWAYSVACVRANKIGGRKFHNKQYGGGIAFHSQSHRLEETEASIARMLEKEGVKA